MIFFGTDKSKNPGDFAEIYEWLPFDVPCINSITSLREMQDYDLEKFSEEFGCTKSMLF